MPYVLDPVKGLCVIAAGKLIPTDRKPRRGDTLLVGKRKLRWAVRKQVWY